MRRPGTNTTAARRRRPPSDLSHLHLIDPSPSAAIPSSSSSGDPRRAHPPSRRRRRPGRRPRTATRRLSGGRRSAPRQPIPAAAAHRPSPPVMFYAAAGWPRTWPCGGGVRPVRPLGLGLGKGRDERRLPDRRFRWVVPPIREQQGRCNRRDSEVRSLCNLYSLCAAYVSFTSTGHLFSAECRTASIDPAKEKEKNHLDSQLYTLEDRSIIATDVHVCLLVGRTDRCTSSVRFGCSS